LKEIQKAVKPEEGWGLKMKGYMREFPDKYYAPREARASEHEQSYKGEIL